MHEAVFREFDRICRGRGARGAVLEIGATPTSNTLLCLPALRTVEERIGLDLAGPTEGAGFQILRGNANQMDAFGDARFDTVLCNSMLEHDRCFWKTLAEIRRVARPGALIALGVPGYVATPPSRLLLLLSRLPVLRRYTEAALASTPTLLVHNYPGDYYRFSAQAMREVMLDGLEQIEVTELLHPPRLIGSGFMPGQASA